MTFLNPKEQVLDIQLTSYGKYLLSLGKFRPAFFSFYDDDVLYDSQYVGFVSESQNNIHDRIKKQTPYLSTQYLYHGLETEINEINKIIRANAVTNEDLFDNLKNRKIPPTVEKHYSLGMAIGNINIESVCAPAWSLNVIQGSISGSVYYQSGSQTNLKIPQINMFPITYKTIAQTNIPVEQVGGSLSLEQNNIGFLDNEIVTEKYSDGSFIQVFEDTLIFEVEEHNTSFENKNFDIEVFKVEQITGSNRNTKEVLTQLSFISNKPNIVQNDILLDDDEIRTLNNNNIDPDTSNVEYFFEILIDNDIDQTLLCDFINNKTEGLLLGQMIDCNIPKVKPNNVLYVSKTQEDKQC